MAGRKPESFTKDENDALRAAFRALREERGWSQAEAGRQVGIGQQAAGTLLNKGGGFGRRTAERLAQLLGAESANAIVHAAGAAPSPVTVPSGWRDRELAVAIARRLGYEEEVIRRVVVKFQEDQHKSRTARWWNDRIVIEAAEYAATTEAAALAPANNISAPPRSVEPEPIVAKKTKEPRRRKAG